MNIAFHYIYRDGANYKNFNRVIFENDLNLSIDHLKDILKSNLISEEYFYADDWKLPDLHFGSWDEEFDHDFHTFEGVEYVSDKPNITIKLSEFLKIVQEIN